MITNHTVSANGAKQLRRSLSPTTAKKRRGDSYASRPAAGHLHFLGCASGSNDSRAFLDFSGVGNCRRVTTVLRSGLASIAPGARRRRAEAVPPCLTSRRQLLAADRAGCGDSPRSSASPLQLFGQLRVHRREALGHPDTPRGAQVRLRLHSFVATPNLPIFNITQ